LSKSEEQKLGVGLPDHLDQTNDTEMYFFGYKIFQIPVLQLVDNSAANKQNDLGFSHALPAAHAAWLNTQNCA